jgi:hypothetical protein
VVVERKDLHFTNNCNQNEIEQIPEVDDDTMLFNEKSSVEKVVVQGDSSFAEPSLDFSISNDAISKFT